MSAPLFKKKIGKVSFTIWDSNFGKTVKVEKSYKCKTSEEWKSTNSYFHNEIRSLLEGLKEVEDFLNNGAEVHLTPTLLSQTLSQEELEAQIDADDIPF